MKKTRGLRTKAQNLALGLFMSDYPDDATFNEILQMLSDGDENVTAWEPFEDWDGDELAEQIGSHAQSIQEAYR